MEDEDLVEDLEKAEEKQNVESEFTDEDLDKTLEDDKAFSSHEEKRVCIKNSYSEVGLFIILKLGLIILKAVSLIFLTIH